jgi:hypothetical protein
MARQNQQPVMDSGLVDLMGLAQAGNLMGFDQPPPVNEIVKLLTAATDMRAQEQELALKRGQLDLARQKQQELGPDMVTALLPYLISSPEASRNLINRAEPGLLPAQPQAVAPSGDLGTGAAALPKGRLNVKSQKAFTGYQPPATDAEAILDANGNIINFVRPGTTTGLPGFVPDAASVGGWGASKYAVSQQMKSLGRALGLIPQEQTIQPY